MADEDKKVEGANSSNFRLLFLSVLVLALGITFKSFPLNYLYPDHQSAATSPEKEFVIEGGWRTDLKDMLVHPGPCNIPVIDGEAISQEDFLKLFAYRSPVVIQYKPNRNERFRKMCEREELLTDWGGATVKLSSSNTYSYETKDVSLRQYVEKMVGPQNLRALANETFYFFGYNDLKGWKEFFDAYLQPHYTIPNHDLALSFGLGGPGSGVPFHFHGPGFSETLHGTKRWFLTPYEVVPEFNPNKTTLQWFHEDFEGLSRTTKFFECTISPGQAIYFPDRWWHATLNIDTSVFISTFLSP